MNYHPTIRAREIKQTNKQTNNLLTLTVSCEKRSYLIRNKEEKQNKTSTAPVDPGIKKWKLQTKIFLIVPIL